MFWNKSTHQSSSRTILIGAVCLFIGAVLCFCGSAADVQAATISFNYTESFGQTPPDGPAPWATAVFDDGGTPGTVTLTLALPITINEADAEAFYFNLDPSLDPTSLSFLHTGGTGPSAGDTDFFTGVDAFQADGDGIYDILIDLPPPPGTPAKRFQAGETVTIDISGIPTLVAADFDVLSAPAPGPGGAGPFLSVARFLSTGPGPSNPDSDWVGATMPEPSTLVLLSLGSLALVTRRRGPRA
jgi:hypothetical protein